MNQHKDTVEQFVVVQTFEAILTAVALQCCFSRRYYDAAFPVARIKQVLRDKSPELRWQGPIS